MAHLLQIILHRQKLVHLTRIVGLHLEHPSAFVRIGVHQPRLRVQRIIDGGDGAADAAVKVAGGFDGFDFAEALSFTGETGVYVQYAAVRAAKILGKLEERGETLPDFRSALSREAMVRQLADERLWQAVLIASKADAAIEQAVTSGEPSHVARYAFQLAQAFSTFYQDFPVVTETDVEKKSFLLWLTTYFRAQLERTLRVLGIDVPEYM